MSNSDFHRISTLLEASLTGQLEVHEREELEKALGESEELRRAYLKAMSLHLDLERLSRTDEDLLDVGTQAEARSPEIHRSTDRDSTNRDRADGLSANRWSTPLLLAALAICLMVATFAVTVYMTSPEHPPGPTDIGAVVGDAEAGDPVTGDPVTGDPVTGGPEEEPAAVAPEGRSAEVPVREAPAEVTLPVIVEVANAVIFGEGRTPQPGQPIDLNRKYILTEGYLAIRFSSGARAVVQAPAVFSALGAERFLVRSGQCSVYAPPGAEGFQLLSPSAEIVDLGTKFVVDVAETGETQLSVIEGEATMAALGEAATVPQIHLFDGDTAQVDPGLPPRRMESPRQQLAYLERLPDRVVSYEATTVDSLAEELLSITIQRDGITRTFQQDALIRGRVDTFTAAAETATFCTRMGDSLPEGPERLSLLHGDFSLVTGIINPSASSSQDVCMTIRFDEPIVNAPGPDIVIFDLQLLVYDPNGDILSLRSGDGRPSRPKLLVEQFDIRLNSPFALDLLPHCTYRSLEPTTSVDDLVHKQFMHGRQVNVDARALAVGVDLSDLGYEEGESLERLDFLPDTGGVDPVLIVGIRSKDR